MFWTKETQYVEVTSENTRFLQKKVKAQTEELAKLQLVRYENKVLRAKLREVINEMKCQESYLEGIADGLNGRV